jgi:hypothetical protein
MPYFDCEDIYDLMNKLGQKTIDVPYPDGGGAMIVINDDETEIRVEYTGDSY